MINNSLVTSGPKCKPPLWEEIVIVGHPLARAAKLRAPLFVKIKVFFLPSCGTTNTALGIEASMRLFGPKNKKLTCIIKTKLFLKT